MGHMDADIYLELRMLGHDRDSFCKEIGVGVGTFSCVINGWRPGKSLLEKLEEYPRLKDAIIRNMERKRKERDNAYRNKIESKRQI